MIMVFVHLQGLFYAGHIESFELNEAKSNIFWN